MVIINGDLKGHVRKKCMDMTLFIWGTNGKHVLEISSVLDMIVCNTGFKKIDMKVIPGKEEVVSQHHTIDSAVKIKPYKAQKQPFIP